MPVHTHYCEPFAGGASIFFAKEKSSVSILNDLDTGVMNTLGQIKNNVEALIDLLQGIHATKENHYYYKNEYKPQNESEQAFRWYYLNRTSYSGIMRDDNCYWGYGEKYSMRPENWPPHLRTVSDKLQGVSLFSLDFEDIISKLPDGFFLFVDPPYFNADQQKFYNCTFTLEDHKKLASCLQKHSRRCRFLLTYDDCPEVRSLYSWADFLSEQEWNYAINRTEDQRNGLKRINGFKQQRNKGQELFIGNYHV